MSDAVSRSRERRDRVAEDPQAVAFGRRGRGGSSGGGGAGRRTARGGASGRRSGRSGRRRPPRRPASRWGWRGSPAVGRPVVVDVAEDDLAGRLEGGEGRRVGDEELPLAVGDGQLDRLVVGHERREARASGRGGPSATRSGPSRCSVSVAAPAVGAAGQEARPDQDLEAVADPQDQAAAVVEPAEGVAQDGPEPGGEDPAGAEVVAVGEAAGDGQDLEGVERVGRLERAGRRARSRRRPRPAPRRRPSPRRSWSRALAGRSRGAWHGELSVSRSAIVDGDGSDRSQIIGSDPSVGSSVTAVARAVGGDRVVGLGAVGEVAADQVGLVDLDDEVGGDLEPGRGPLGREVGRGPAAELGHADVLGPALHVVDPGDAVGVARDQEGDVVGVLERDHVDGQARVEPLLVERVVQQVDLPVPLLADLDEVGRGLDAVVEPLLPLQGPALALVPLAGLGEAEVPGLLDPAVGGEVGHAAA